MATPEELAAQGIAVQPASGMPVLVDEPMSDRPLVVDSTPPLSSEDLAAMRAVPGVSQQGLDQLGKQVSAREAPATQAAPAPSAPQQYVSEPGRAQDPFAVVGYMPGGSSTTTATTDLGKAGKEARAASDAAFNKAGGAAQQLQSVEEQRAAARAEQAAANVKIGEQFAAREVLEAQRAQARNQEALAALQKSQDDYDQAARELGPNRFWQQQSTGQKIGNLLSIALSGLGQVFSAKAGVQARNGALDMVNLAIDRDIDMQKTALQAKERGIRTKESAYMMARQAGADEAQATALAKASAYQQTALALESKLAATGDAEAKARGEQLHAQLMQARAAELQRVAEIQAKRTQTTSSSTPVTAMQVQGLAAQQAGLVPKDPKLTTPYGQAPDQETRRLMIKQGGRLKQIERALQVASQGSASGLTSPGKKAAIDQAWSTIAGWVRSEDVNNTGSAMSDNEKSMLLDPNLSDSDVMTRSEKRNAVIAALRKLHSLKMDEVKQYAVRTTL